jgi:hypothetical protein
VRLPEFFYKANIVEEWQINPEASAKLFYDDKRLAPAVPALR